MDPGELSVLNPSPQRMEGPRLLHHLVRAGSDRTALEHLKDDLICSFTYAELHKASDVIARRIWQATPDTNEDFIVPVLLPQGPELYASLLGILKAGGAFCPLQLDIPIDRLNFVLDDVSANVVVVSDDFGSRDLIPKHIKIIRVTGLDTSSELDSRITCRNTAPSDLAYVMYTSGSTGMPKGVAISHEAATQSLLAHKNQIPEFTRFFQFAAPTFDVSVFEIFFTLSQGKILASAARSSTLDDLPAVLNAMKADACELTPTVAARLLRKRSAAPKLRLLLTIGEMLTKSVISEFGDLDAGHSMLWAMYGPTEATIHCTLQPALSGTAAVGSIGAPLQTVSCFVVDRDEPMTQHNELNLLPRGQVGELVIGGHQLATCYLNRPEQNAKAFLHTQGFGRVYRTGDLVKINQTGLLECLGRLSDGQIKLHGQRIELGEIEHAMTSEADCHLAKVIAINSIIVGFCATESAVTEASIRDRCVRWLPPHMVPTEIIVLRDFPRLPSGKIDNESLRVIFNSRDESTSATPDIPSQEHDIKLLEAISVFLGRGVSPMQSLSSLGIDSLRAIALASFLRQAKRNIGVSTIMRARTVSDLCSQSSDHTRASPTSVSRSTSYMNHLQEIVENDAILSPFITQIENVTECTPLQSAMLAASLHEASLHINEVEVEVCEEASPERLSAGLYNIVRDNEILRTGFAQWRGKFVAAIFGAPPKHTIEIKSQGREDSSPFSVSWQLPLKVQIVPAADARRARLIFTIHHAIYDGWSFDAILSDLSRTLSGAEVVLRPQFQRITDYHSITASHDLSRTNSFWADYLLGWKRKLFPVLIETPSANNERDFVHHSFALSDDQLRRVKERTDCGLPSLFSAALCLLWKGVLNVDDLVIGTTTSGRTLPIEKIDEIVGPCVAALPLRVQFSHIETSDQLIRFIESTLTSLMEHSALPLTKVKKLAGLQTSEPLYDVLFTYQESLYSDRVRESPFRQLRHLDRIETRLLVEAERTINGFQLQATFHTEVMDRAMATEMLNELATIISNIIADGDIRIKKPCSFPGMVPSIHHHPVKRYDNVPDLAANFEETSRKFASSSAIDFMSFQGAPKRETVTFQELNSRANRVARLLQAQDAKQNDVIAIVMEKSVMLYVCILGTLKAGCAYLPLLPNTPSLRIREILEQASVSLCLTDETVKDRLDSDGNVRWLVASANELQCLSSENLSIPPDGNRLAYIIFTSGTTGAPKGVAITQRNITSNIAHLRLQYPVDHSQQPRLLQACSQAFDVSVFEIFFSWLSGMCLCAGTSDDLLEDIEHSIRSLGITHLSLTPTVASMIDPVNVPSVRFIVTAGEPMTRNVLSRWGSLLWQGYGPSETTNICTVKQMDPANNIEHLGKSFPNTSVMVVGTHGLDPLPKGWAGELCFGGEQVGQGYINDAQLTSTKFVFHEKYGKLYRSGDLGRMLPNGSLVILGRLDNQVKLRGQRVETAEIDQILSLHEAVHQSVTLLIVDDKKSDKQHLTSFFTVRDITATRSPQPLKIGRDIHLSIGAMLKSRLPSYMVPTYAVPISQIPQTSSGKIDRLALQETLQGLTSEQLDRAAMSAISSQGDDDEWQPAELALRAAIAKSLDTVEQDIGRWTSLTSVGLDSMSAIHVARSISDMLDLRVAISTVLLYPCVALLNKHVAQHNRRTSSTYETPLIHEELRNAISSRFNAEVEPVADILPCTPLQEAMLSQRHGNCYNKILLRLRTPSEDMRSFWAESCQRHEIMRTCFVTTADPKFPIVQVVLKISKIPWTPYTMLETSMKQAVENQVQSLQVPLDSKRPPLSFAIITHGQTEFLSFVCHHALYDGTSMNVLWREIEAMAHGQSLLPPPSFEPFLREAQRLPDDWSEFWRTQLHDCRSKQAFGRNSSSTIQHSIHTAELSLRLSECQQKLRSLNMSLLSLCQAAWASVLTVLTGSHDVLFGNVVNGRNVDLPSIERLVAPCFNTIPVRQALDTRVQNLDVLRDFQELNKKLLPYQFTPLRTLSKAANSRFLFDTLLLVQQPLEEMDETVWTLEDDYGSIDLPILCEIVPCPKQDSLSVSIHYDMQEVSLQEIAGIASEFIQNLMQMIRSPFAQLDLGSKSGLGQRRPTHTIQSLRGAEMHTEESTDDSWTPKELLVREALSALSDIPISSIARRTSFFRIGVDSISASQLAGVIRRKGLRVSTADVLRNPNCSQLAQSLEEASSNGSEEQIISFDFQGFQRLVAAQIHEAVHPDLRIEDIMPCTPAQCAMATAFSLNSDSYMNLISFKLGTGLEVDQVATAWKKVHQQTPMLRTALVRVDLREVSYAMVQYSSDTCELPLESFHQPEGVPMRGAALKRSIGQRLQGTPYLPPWAVVLSQGEDTCDMHLIVHHALYDAVSMRTVLSNLAAAMIGQGVSRGCDPRIGLSELLGNYEARDDEISSYWQSLASQVAVNRFPTLTPLKESPGHRLTATLTANMAFSSILERTRAMDVTVQAIIEAAWTRLLARYTGESAVVFGVTLSTRTTDATSCSPVPCLTTLPVIVADVDSDHELVKSVMDYDAKLGAARHCSLVDVKRWLGHPASAIFDTLITYQGNLPALGSEHPWIITDEIGAVEYPVVLEIQPGLQDQLLLTLAYTTSTVPSAQADYILRQFDAIFTGLLTSDGISTDQIFKIHPELFSVLSAQVDEIPTQIQLLHELVERQVAKSPHAPALEWVESRESPPQVWTYQELDDMGNRVACLLQSLDLDGSLVAVHFDKCPEAYFAILGVLKAGFAFVALDPAMPKARKEFIMEDSKACCMLTAPHAALQFDTKVPSQMIEVASLCASEPSQGLRRQSRHAEPQDTCYCLYTSGTTGTPKGCEITHENAVQAMMAFQHLFRGRWNHESRWLQFASLHFDVSILEQYWTWSVGMTLVVTPREVILDDLAGTLSRLRITHLDLTPSLARLLDPEQVPTLWKGVFITGGEPLKQEILDAWGPKGVIYNSYGPTEATIGVTTYPQVPQNGRPSNIGKQFVNVSTYVLHPGTDSPVLRGGVGELCIGGKLVGKGYINRDSLTRERFQWLEAFSQRVYRTGDLVRLLFDGSFDFLGRADDQVKLRGQRLELGEIDHVIRKFVVEVEAVATTLVTRKSSDQTVLVCFLSDGKGKIHILKPVEDEYGLGRLAREACRSRLPAYMVPSYFIVIPYIPLSSNNKAEHKVLRGMFQELSSAELLDLNKPLPAHMSHRGQQALDSLIQTTAAFVQCKVSQLHASSSILDFGIDSINVHPFAQALRNSGTPCPPALILQNPILADLAEAAASLKTDQTDILTREATLAVKACFHRHFHTVRKTLGWNTEDIDYIAPCTPLQEGMVSSVLTKQQAGVYLLSFDLLLSAAVDTGVLRSSWLALIRKHAILRSSFIHTSDGCIQAAARFADIDWVEVSTATERQGRKQTWLQSNASCIRKPIQLTLLRTKEEMKLCVDIFHGIYDGTSLESMLRQVKETYYHAQTSEAPSFLQAMIKGPLWRFDFCRDFWEHHLQGWTAPGFLSSETPVKRIAVSAGTVLPRNDIELLLRRGKCTRQSLILALWTSTLYRLNGIEPTVGLVVGGRTLDVANIENTIGPMFNTLPFFSGSCPGHEWGHLLMHCYRFCSATLDFQHVPLRSIQKWCNSGQPMIDNVLTFQAEPRTTDLAAACLEDLWVLQDSEASTGFPLALEAVLQRNGDIKLHLVAIDEVDKLQPLQDILDQMRESLSLISRSTTGRWQQPTTGDNVTASSKTVPMKAAQRTSRPLEWTETTKLLAHALSQLVHCPPESLKATTTVVELGLDSIDMLRLSSLMRHHGMDFAPSLIMRCRTIGELSSLQSPVSASQPQPAILTDVEGPRRRLMAMAATNNHMKESIEDAWPVTPVQEGMIMGMLESDFAQYFNHEVLQMPADIDLTRLRAAWQLIVKENPVLRSGFVEVLDDVVSTSYCQVVHAFNPLKISQHEFECFEDIRTLFQTAKLVAKQSRGQTNMIQVRLAAIGALKYMIISVSHALYDGWSLGLLYADLQQAYYGKPVERASPEQYLWNRVGKNDTEAGIFWNDFIEGAEPTLLSPDVNSTNLSSTPFMDELRSQSSTARLMEFCKGQGISLQALCYACWAIVVGRHTGQLDVCFGAVISGRDFEGAENLMFPTMNTIVQRCILSGTCSSFLSNVESDLRDVRQWQFYPLRKVLRTTSDGRPLFDSLFTVQKGLVPSEATEGMFKPVIGQSLTEYAICAESELVNDTLIWRIASRTPSLLASESSQLLAALDSVLSYFMDFPDHGLLRTEGSSISICGLSPCLIRAEDPNTQQAVNTLGENHIGMEWTPTSRAIAAGLSAVSHVPQSDIQLWNSIYHLGLDSITSLKASALLRRNGLMLSPKDLLSASNLAELACVVDQRSNEVKSSDNVIAESQRTWVPGLELDLDTPLLSKYASEADVETVLPALPFQVYTLWFWYANSGTIFFPEFRFKLPSSVSKSRVAEAWRTLRKEMPLLRTSFRATGSDDVPLLQLIRRPDAEPEDHSWVVCWAETDAMNETIVTLKIHHALYDAFSLSHVRQRLCALCSGDSKEHSQSAVKLWPEFVARTLFSEHRKARETFWRQYLGGAAASMEISHSPNSSSVPLRTSYVNRTAMPDVKDLRDAAANAGISVQALFIAAHAKIMTEHRALSRKSGALVIGIYYANRDEANSLSPSCPTLCVVPLKVNISPGKSLLASAMAVHRDLNTFRSEGVAEVGLWEIKHWTGVVVDSIVNFVGNDTDAAGDSDPSWLPPRDQEQGPPGVVSPEAFGHWDHELLREAYPPVIEVEAALTGSAMTVGAFAPSSLLSEREATLLISRIVKTLVEGIS